VPFQSVYVFQETTPYVHITYLIIVFCGPERTKWHLRIQLLIYTWIHIDVLKINTILAFLAQRTKYFVEFVYVFFKVFVFLKQISK